MDPNVSTQDAPHKDQTPLVSVIIPAYKVAAFTRETLDSVLAQTFTDYEIIVINDGSPDTEELERAIEPYRDRLVYIKQQNRGAGAARNAGLRAAGGRFVAFLDGDDIWFPSFLQEQLQLIQGGGYDLVYADAVNFGDPSSAGRTSMATNPSEGQVTFGSLMTAQCNVITSAVVARRAPIMHVGLFDESFPNSQDFDLWLRLARDAQARITYQRKVLVRRRIYPGSLASDPTKSLAGELHVLEKVGRRGDLTNEERVTLERTIAHRQAAVEVVRGKRRLLEGNFDDAIRSFEFANNCFHSWKLRFVVLWLRMAPRLLQYAYRLRPI